jgi:hypothetical protein
MLASKGALSGGRTSTPRGWTGLPGSLIVAGCAQAAGAQLNAQTAKTTTTPVVRRKIIKFASFPGTPSNFLTGASQLPHRNAIIHIKTRTVFFNKLF